MTDIVITGIGVISSLGIGKNAFWENYSKAETGIKKITAFDTSAFQSDIAGPIDDFNPKDFMSPLIYRRMSRISRMAVSASIEAVEDSGIQLEEINKERVAIIMGTSLGSSSHVEDFYASLLQDGPRGAQPLLFPETVPNAAASHIAMFHKINGPNTTFCHNDVSAENAILYAKNLLDQDLVDAVIVGGADELSSMQFSCYNALDMLNKTKTADAGPLRPEPGRGIVLGEGAAILVMEKYETAVKRGAEIYGALKSGISTGGAAAVADYDVSGEQTARGMTEALEQAGIQPDAVHQIDVSANAYGTLDRIEYQQLDKIFADRINSLYVTPLKYLTGDFGGAGTLRAAAILLSIHHQQFMPAVPAYVLKCESDSPLEWINHDHRQSDEGPVNALMTTTSFGGGSASLFFSKI